MRKIGVLGTLSLLCVNLILAQTPNLMSYQAVIWDASGNLVSDKMVSIKLSILQGSPTGIVVYSETHKPQTNSNGLVSLMIGGGTNASGKILDINWGNGSFFLKTETDPTGGSNFNILGTTQFISVPYSIFSGKTESLVTVNPGIPGQVLMLEKDGKMKWIGDYPTITTNAVTSISQTSATSGGSIISDGGLPVVSQGVVWSTSPIPTVSLPTKTTDGSEIGSFSSNITGLSPNTSYYVRAYATNSVGTSYGNEVSFKTLILPVPPTVITTSSTDIYYTTITSGGNVTFNGGSDVLARGVIWSKTDVPTITLTTKTLNGIGNGSFISYLFGLTPNTTYYIRAYAINSAGLTGYGKVDTIKTRTWVNCPSTIKDIDNNVYNVVAIGFQCWTKENMKVSKYSNGDEIPIIINGVSWASLTTGSRCWYLNDSVTYENPYGNLYNWYAASDPRGICPTGWHVPTASEWTTLTDYLGGEGIAGGKMKATGNAYEEGNIGASNSSGFTGYGGGFREGIQEPGYFDGQFDRIKLYARFWSSSSYNNPWAWSQALYYYNQTIGRGPEKKGRGFSVRCLRD